MLADRLTGMSEVSLRFVRSLLKITITPAAFTLIQVCNSNFHRFINKLITNVPSVHYYSFVWDNESKVAYCLVHYCPDRSIICITVYMIIQCMYSYAFVWTNTTNLGCIRGV